MNIENEETLDSLIDEIDSALDDGIQENGNQVDDEINPTIDKKKILELVDPSDIGLDEYEVFLSYAIGHINTIVRKEIKIKVPSKSEIMEMAQDALSIAIETFDINVAIEKKSVFVTHLGWKTRQVVTDAARAHKKASINELNTSDEEFANSLNENLLKSDEEGNFISQGESNIPEHHRDRKISQEYGKKVEMAMGQVRHELPRESNLLLDISIGEVYKDDGEPYTIIEWATHTNQDPAELRVIIRGAKRLIRQKLSRKGYMIIIYDDEKTSEDLLKDTNIQEQIKIQEADESIIASTDIKTLIDDCEDILDEAGALKDLLKDDNE